MGVHGRRGIDRETAGGQVAPGRRCLPAEGEDDSERDHAHKGEETDVGSDSAGRGFFWELCRSTLKMYHNVTISAACHPASRGRHLHARRWDAHERRAGTHGGCPFPLDGGGFRERVKVRGCRNPTSRNAEQTGRVQAEDLALIRPVQPASPRRLEGALLGGEGEVAGEKDAGDARHGRCCRVCCGRV